MVTSFDKALIAAIGALIFFVNFFFGTEFALSPETQNFISGAVVFIMPWLVYFLPNKGAVYDPNVEDKMDELRRLRKEKLSSWTDKVGNK